MDARVDDVLDELRSRGIARLRGAVAPSIVARLNRAAERLSATPSKSWDEALCWLIEARWQASHFAGGGRNRNYYDCLGVDAELDLAVEEILAAPAIVELLDRGVGADRRLWYAQLRWAEPGGDEYLLHQDVFGELGLCIYLSDHPDSEGSMAFWPGSHRWPRALEILPPLEPRFVKGRVVAIDGVAGDVCVFLNKTWHGRTSARGKSRLVMLLSFLPPGPVEKARRVPDEVRVRLPPRLRAVTAPQAGRAFGRRPPALLPFSSTFEDPDDGRASGCTFVAHAGRSIAAYAWAWCRAHAGFDAASGAEAGALDRHRWLVKGIAAFPELPRRTIDALLDDFRRRAEAKGKSARASHFLRMVHALWCGEPERARAEARLWPALARDDASECPACEIDALVGLHVELGEDEAALAAARPLVEGEIACAHLSGATFSRLLLPLVRLGRFDEAERAHARGHPRVARKREQLGAIGRHLEYLALREDPRDGLQLLREHERLAADEQSEGELWHLRCGEWLLHARAPASVAPDVAPRLRERLEEVAGRFDRRNGNDHRARELERLAERIGWPPLPRAAASAGPDAPTSSPPRSPSG
jgi:putative 2OG-Fe(II) oxygenase